MARIEERIDVGIGPSPAVDAATHPRPRGDLARLPWVSFFIIALLVVVAVLILRPAGLFRKATA